jgi:predicted AlkP superfamily phosphohydrolase/phosphomutase
MTARLLMIALDAADGRLLEEWINAGALPNLAALGARGAVKRLTVPYDTDDAHWASFQYGVPVGEHGRYHYRIQLSTGKFGMAHIQEGDRNPFWRDLANQGLRVAVCRNVPHPSR